MGQEVNLDMQWAFEVAYFTYELCLPGSAKVYI
jgi:hypothetical protein